jgi:hypothetical protein
VFWMFWRLAVSENIPFDEEKFCNHCCPSCNKGRRLFLDKIKQYKESEPEMVQWLEWHRDRLWRDQIKADKFRSMRREKSDEQINKEAAAALRAMADKLEENGPHFMIHCELPPMPIFSGSDSVERYFSHIEISMVAGPLGG